MNNLLNTTLIIPVCIESEDRMKNAISVLGYLNHHFNTNVIIHEKYSDEPKLTFLNQYKNLNIEYITEKFPSDYYHRTRQLNEMLYMVKTPVVSNYDIDVILPVESYLEAERLLLNNVCDVVYPYGNGEYQMRIFTKFNRSEFNDTFDLNSITPSNFDYHTSVYGHCMFIKTDIYKKCGAENEEFIQYAPEDCERYNRFIKLDYRLGRVNSLVCHFEHSRTAFSNDRHNKFNDNNNLWKKLETFNKNELIDYYNNVEYLKKYKDL